MDNIVTGYAKMWPREVFDIRDKRNKFLGIVKERLREPGVYVLYENDQPYYFGQTTGALFKLLGSTQYAPEILTTTFGTFSRLLMSLTRRILARWKRF